MPKSYSVRQPGLAFVSGVLVGSLGGLIGLGGAEFRLPLLLTLFELYPHRAVRFNLLVSFITLAFAALTRLQFGIELHAHFDIVLSMIGGGIVAAWIGARLLSAVSANRLIAIISGLLLLIAALLLAEVLLHDAALPKLPDEPLLRIITGALAGLLIGAVSSFLGVAGGEFIIPMLIFVFGVDIKTAGTLSLVISLPVVAIGVFRHRWSGHYRSTDVLVYLVAPMGLGSIIGAVAGGLLSNYVANHALKTGLAAILAVSAIKLWGHRSSG